MAVSLLKPVGCSENLSEPTTLVVGSANNTLKRINTYVIDQKGDSVMIPWLYLSKYCAATFLSTCHGTYLQISGTLNWKVSLFIYLFMFGWFCFVLKELERQRDLPSLGSLSRWPQWLKLDQVETSFWVFQMGSRGPGIRPSFAFPGH